jgi:hypothetical protein
MGITYQFFPRHVARGCHPCCLRFFSLSHFLAFFVRPWLASGFSTGLELDLQIFDNKIYTNALLT